MIYLKAENEVCEGSLGDAGYCSPETACLRLLGKKATIKESLIVNHYL